MAFALFTRYVTPIIAFVAGIIGMDQELIGPVFRVTAILAAAMMASMLCEYISTRWLHRVTALGLVSWLLASAGEQHFALQAMLGAVTCVSLAMICRSNALAKPQADAEATPATGEPPA